ncbi:FIST N-terminal domain-containing protein [Frigidibacter sp. MR17.14]|uniref:FIST N-terminal domain-containing protein n=1 Tax=Frigidibacter sp. MR17.14 TaxID=3126509 RepID=UPI003012BB1A
MTAHAQAALPPAVTDLIRSADVPAFRPDAGRLIAERLGPGPFALVLLFLSPETDFSRLRASLAQAMPGVRIVGCTTAGEISERGYDEGTIVAVGLPTAHFAAETVPIPDLDDFDPQDLATGLVRTRQSLARRSRGFTHEFAFLLVDGLSVKEDELAAALAQGLGPVPLFGGSAGDGTRFRETLILQGGQLLKNAAVLSLVRTDCPIRVFNLDHLVPTELRMVVTEADPARRIVRQINAEPAAREYARILGKDPDQLTPFTFAAHPLVVRVGGRHHVRAIQQVAENGDLVFFAAIDEGLVLTVAEPSDMADHLAGELAALCEPGAPEAILGCDCILRRLEAEQKQMNGKLSELFRRFNVRGFSTYGEQRGAMHVNQTFTGIAFYPPGGGKAE